ncbi:MAG TPA: hypothetical protein VGE75_06000 [Acidimicrobiales bacterium]|jgi:hypothetical protein
MTESADAVHLNNHHRDTLVSLFQHPTSHNIDWKAVLSLLNAVGTVEETTEGKYHITVGGEDQVFVRPRNKDIDVQTVVDLRRMLTSAGYATVVKNAIDEGKEV